MPPRRTPPNNAASCNLLVERGAFERAGRFAEDVWTGEDTLLSFPFGQRGRLGWAPGAQVRHLNRTTLRSFLLDQYKHGVGFQTICARLDFPSAPAVRGRRLGIALAFRLGGLTKRLLGLPAQLVHAVLLSPLIFVGLAVWLWGLRNAARHPYPALPRSLIR